MGPTASAGTSSTQALQRQTVVSAPGKVLVAGGYLVLEPAYPGLVLATTARFYSVVTNETDKGVSRGSASSSSRRIRVRSPQFLGAQWEYLATVKGEQCHVRQTRETFDCPTSGRNPFVAYALLYSLRLALEARDPHDVLESMGDSGLDIHVVADNDFYSQRTGTEAPSSAALKALPPFNKQNCAIRDVHKTGLGSSAAMTTSFVGAMLVHLGVVHADEAAGALGDEELALIHNTAQLAHCAAQGKVGSGFDVSAAIWGSQLYRRFDKEAIQNLLNAGEAIGIIGESDEMADQTLVELSPYLDPRNHLWRPSPLSSVGQGQANPTATEGLASAQLDGVDNEQLGPSRPAPLELPPHVELALADVDAGSNTPSMVGKIMAWRKSKPEWAQQMWTILATGNQTLADALLALRLAHAQDSKGYAAAIALASQHFSKDWDTVVKVNPSPTLALLIEVRNAMRAIQGGLRELGRQADVPVQPDEMGNVIKATVDGAKGVLGGGVPGAGGYDALFVLYLNADASNSPKEDKEATYSTREQIEGVWSHWKALSVGPLLSEAGAAAGVSSSAAQAQNALLMRGAPVGMAASLPLPGTDKLEPGGLCLHRLADVVGLHSAINI